MKRLAAIGLLLAAAAGAVFIPEQPIEPESAPEPESPRYDADCIDVSVFVNGVQVITKARSITHYCDERVALLSECPIFADGLEPPANPTEPQ